MTPSLFSAALPDLSTPVLVLDVLVWWLSQAEADDIGDDLPERFPRYMREQYRSALGRAGRGRLWVDGWFGAITISPWPETAAGRWAERCTGIVIETHDASLLEQMPGMVTDLQLRRCGNWLRDV